MPFCRTSKPQLLEQPPQELELNGEYKLIIQPNKITPKLVLPS
jgi:hypothetical protein